MSGMIIRWTAIAATCMSLAACGSVSEISLPPVSTGSLDTSILPQECVPYARAVSGIDLYGDAYTWWDQAAGRFERRTVPMVGSVLVLNNYAGPDRAHLAVVQQIESDREIRVDHANWLNDGAVFVDDPVVDVSPDNDWSAVRVFNVRTGSWGGRVYPVQGFIAPNTPLPAPQTAPPTDPIAALLIAQTPDK